DENSSGTSCTATWASFTSVTNSGIYRRTTTDIDPAAPGTATSRSGTLAQIQLQSGAIPSCVPPLGLDASNITATGAELTWLNSTSNPADGYQWEVRDDLDAVVASGSTLAGDITATASGLNAETDYNLYVR